MPLFATRRRKYYSAISGITALASATGEKDTPGRRGAKPPDSIEQGRSLLFDGRSKNATRGKRFQRSLKPASAVIHDFVNFENRVSKKLTSEGS